MHIYPLAKFNNLNLSLKR